MKIEKAILSAVEFPSVLACSRVDLNEKKEYVATFDNGGEKIVKEFATIKKANDWLVTMTCSYKAGGVRKHLRQAEKDVKADAELGKVLDSCLASQGSLPNALATSPNLASTRAASAEDVTLTILRPTKTYTCELPSSNLLVHKGSLKTLAKSGSHDPDLKAILLGKIGWNGKFHVTNMVMSHESFDSLVASESVKDFCKRKGMMTCGFWARGPRNEVRECLPKLLEKVSNASCLFLGVDYTHSLVGDPYAFEWDSSSDNAIIRSVDLTWTSQPRDSEKRMIYNVCWEHQLSTTVLEAATAKVANAVVAYAQSSVGRSQAQDNGPHVPVELKKFRRLVVPADGLCGWHSLIAAEDLDKFSNIPRKGSGYAVCNLVVKREEEAAKELRDSMCQKALEVCEPKFYDAVKRVQLEGQLDPLDLEWVAQAAGRKVIAMGISV
eukprot:Skav210856  [mRNA]  locus=scaffold2829:268688:270710:+ [translate_table: standard]